MIKNVSNDNDFKEPIYVFIRLGGSSHADLNLVGDDMLQIGAKWLSFTHDDSVDTSSGVWTVMERSAAFFFIIKYAPYIITTFTDREMKLLVLRIEQDTTTVLHALSRIALAKELGYIPDIEHFLYVTETMNLMRIVNDYVRTAYFM